MSARCAVCGAVDGAREFSLADGSRLGVFCPGECFGLGWEAHFIHAIGGTEHQHADIVWRWRRRRAEAQGEPFVAPCPKSPIEKQLDRWAAELPEQDIVRELS